jgi:hypothetical protein
MQYVIGGIFTGIAQACCWYQVFKCCGCIEDSRAQIPAVVVAATGQTKGNQNPNSGPNPFLRPESMGQWDMRSAYIH